jgi:hypothetical protein
MKYVLIKDGARIEVSHAAYEAHRATLRRPPPKPRGLGDLVATLAEPIARFSDAHLGTHLVGCQSCAERRAALNRLIPGK